MKKIIFILLLFPALMFGQATGYVISDKPSGGAIGTAATTVDIISLFNVNQTTTGQTLTVPNLTNAAAGKIIQINNVGSAAFTLTPGGLILTGKGVMLRWTGAAWNVTAGGSGSINPTSTYFPYNNSGTFSDSWLFQDATRVFIANGKHIASANGLAYLDFGSGNTSILGYNTGAIDVNFYAYPTSAYMSYSVTATGKSSEFKADSTAASITTTGEINLTATSDIGLIGDNIALVPSGNLAISTGGAAKWLVESDGDFYPNGGDSLYDFGQSLYRVKDIHFAGNINGTSATELGYVSGVTSAIQTQLDAKQNFPLRQSMRDSDTTYAAGKTEVHLDSVLTAPRVLNLPSASAFSAGTELIFVDEAGGVTGTNYVTITRDGSDLINGDSTFVFSITNGICKLITDGVSKWTTNQLTPYNSGTYTPTWTGFSSAPASDLQWSLVGDICTVIVDGTGGTSNATTLTFTVPFTSDGRAQVVCVSQDNGTVQAGAGRAFTANGSNIVTVNKAMNAAGGWTASGTKMLFCVLQYKIQL